VLVKIDVLLQRDIVKVLILIYDSTLRGNQLLGHLDNTLALRQLSLKPRAASLTGHLSRLFRGTDVQETQTCAWETEVNRSTMVQC
jgi:hypothetical protein